MDNIVLDIKEDKRKIEKANIGIIGVGGCGGLATILLQQMGFCKFLIYDNDKYEISNLNRQMLATVDTIGEYKAEVAKQFLEKKECLVESHTTRLKTVEEITAAFQGMDLIVLTVDNMSTIVKVIRAAKKLSIPVVLAGPFGWKCFASVIMPDGKDYEGMTSSPSFRKNLDETILEQVDMFQREFIVNTNGFKSFYNEELKNINSSIVTLAPTVNLAATAVVLEVTKVILGHGKNYQFPEYFTLDLLSMEPWSIAEVGVKSIHTFNDRMKGREEI